ncbi:hypothetical protein BMS3Abin17_00902 [archaeon BMS3Abin17]|nr:hypothetical protein BMS3Abin17_00902 [archaeon BMS3Abin17]HDZ61385.1 hypothetical protein [Candidatus Pacearchaeota archaeon]
MKLKKTNIKNWVLMAPLVLLLSCVSLGSHPTLEQRAEVRKYSSDKVIPDYILRVKDKDSKKIRKMKDILENVPDAIQKKINDFGGKVLIFEGKMTDNPELSHLKGTFLGYRRVEDLEATYWRKPRIAAVKLVLSGSYGGGNPVLHEYGHLGDHAFGDISESSEFRKVYEANPCTSSYSDGLPLCNSSSVFLSRSEYAYLHEYFATLFADYSFSDRLRAKLKKEYPEAHEFFTNFTMYYASKESRKELKKESPEVYEFYTDLEKTLRVFNNR